MYVHFWAITNISSQRKSKSVATYSRDMLSRPLKYYIEMLGQIRRGFFRPDLSRSGWMSTGFRFPSGEHRNPTPEQSECEEFAGFATGDGFGAPSQLDSVEGAFDLEKEATIGEQAIKEVDDMFRSAGIQFDDQHCSN